MSTDVQVALGIINMRNYTSELQQFTKISLDVSYDRRDGAISETQNYDLVVMDLTKQDR